jgi:hypothetical protein
MPHYLCMCKQGTSGITLRAKAASFGDAAMVRCRMQCSGKGVDRRRLGRKWSRNRAAFAPSGRARSRRPTGQPKSLCILHPCLPWSILRIENHIRTLFPRLHILQTQEITAGLQIQFDTTLAALTGVQYRKLQMRPALLETARGNTHSWYTLYATLCRRRSKT